MYVGFLKNPQNLSTNIKFLKSKLSLSSLLDASAALSIIVVDCSHTSFPVLILSGNFQNNLRKSDLYKFVINFIKTF